MEPKKLTRSLAEFRKPTGEGPVCGLSCARPIGASAGRARGALAAALFGGASSKSGSTLNTRRREPR
jgi:hypothetical protein